MSNFSKIVFHPYLTNLRRRLATSSDPIALVLLPVRRGRRFLLTSSPSSLHPSEIRPKSGRHAWAIGATLWRPADGVVEQQGARCGGQCLAQLCRKARVIDIREDRGEGLNFGEQASKYTTANAPTTAQRRRQAPDPFRVSEAGESAPKQVCVARSLHR